MYPSAKFSFCQQMLPAQKFDEKNFLDFSLLFCHKKQANLEKNRRMRLKNPRIMFDKDLESCNILLFNKNNFRQHLCVFFFQGGIGAIVVHLFSIVSFFTCTRPNRSRVGAIDKLDRSEQVFEQYNIPEDPEKIIKHDFSMVSQAKMFIFGVLDAFIKNFTYYNLY